MKTSQFSGKPIITILDQAEKYSDIRSRQTESCSRRRMAAAVNRLDIEPIQRQYRG